MTKGGSLNIEPFFWLGASAEEADPALVASDQAASRLAPTGFDPLRVPVGYSKLPQGVRCRCVRLWSLNGDYYCCRPGRDL